MTAGKQSPAPDIPWWTRRRVVCLLGTLLALACFGTAPHWQGYGNAAATSPRFAMAQLAIGVATNALTSYFLYYLISFRRWLLAILLPPLLLGMALANYAALAFHLPVDRDLIGITLEANLQEVGGFLRLPLIAYGFLAVLFSAAWIWVRGRERWENGDTLLTVAALAIVAFGFAGERGNQSSRYLPQMLIQAGLDDGRSRVLRPARLDVARLPSAWPGKPARLTVVMVIGESLRADHLGLNGYARQTTPELSRQAGLVSFPHVRSCSALTRTAVPCMMTRKTVAGTERAGEGREITIPETSVTSLFAAQGFETSWIDMQQTRDIADAPSMDMITEAKHVVFPNHETVMPERRDEDILPYLRQALDSPAPYRFIVLHLMGSHWPYPDRYPPAFGKWNPQCPPMPPFNNWFRFDDAIRQCDVITHGLINSYDDSILYSDHVLGAILDSLKGENAFVLFSSDHSESLGEQGRYIHGRMDAPEQRNPGFFLWESPAFLAAHPGDVAAWRQAAPKPLTVDVIFHSLVDCVGLRSAAVNRALSLCSGTVKSP